MDDFQWQAELEAMASNALIPDDRSNDKRPESIGTSMARWQKLFGLTPDEAVERIMQHRQNLTRTRVSTEHWEVVRNDKEAQGHDCESYEYEIELQKKQALLADVVPGIAGSGPEDDPITYLVELAGPLTSAEMIQSVAGLTEPPTLKTGRSVEEERVVQLCCIDGKTRTTLLRWASERGGGFEPIILVDPRSIR
jgi:hypothetical protein